MAVVKIPCPACSTSAATMVRCERCGGERVIYLLGPKIIRRVQQAVAWLLLLAIPLAAQAQSVTLPAEIRGAVGSWVIVAPEKIDGGQPRWRLDAGLQEVRLDLLLPPEMLAKLKGKVVTALAPGRYKVEAWNAKGDVASDIAVCWVVIGNPGPGPGPGPPDPPAKKIAAHITFIGAEKTATSLATNNDAALRAWLAARNVKVHTLKSGDPLIEQTGFSLAVAAAGGLPCLIVQDAVGNVVGQSPLTSSAAVMTFMAAYTKGQ